MQLPDFLFKDLRHTKTANLQPGDVFLPDHRWSDRPLSIACRFWNKQCAIALGGSYPNTIYPLANFELEQNAFRVCQGSDLRVRLSGSAAGLHEAPAISKIGFDDQVAVIRCLIDERSGNVVPSRPGLINLESWVEMKIANAEEGMTWLADWKFVLRDEFGEGVILGSGGESRPTIGPKR